MAETSAVYRPRNPNLSQYYQYVENHFETLEQVHDERFSKQYGYFRPYVKQVIYRYLDCGILHNGFARVKCGDRGHEFLLAFSCKRRHFCPSCHQKRVVEFGQWLCEDVLKAVPHLHFVFSIPKFLRRYFLYNRKLLSDLSRCGWESLKEFFTAVVLENDAVPGAVIAVQTFGGFLGFHPHLHILCTDGCFYRDGMFRVAPLFELRHLEEIFRHKGEQMVRYYGYYSNVSRGKRKIQDKDDAIPSILESGGSSREFRINRARLIQKIYEVDPLTCPKRSGTMKVISVIEDEDVIKKILKHLGLWDLKARPPPNRAKANWVTETTMDYSVSQISPSENHLYFDVQYPVEDSDLSGEAAF